MKKIATIETDVGTGILQYERQDHDEQTPAYRLECRFPDGSVDHLDVYYGTRTLGELIDQIASWYSGPEWELTWMEEV